MINQTLLRLRLHKGLTQEELSERTGLSVRTIRNLERGVISRPRPSSVDLLMSVLDPDLRDSLRTPPADGPKASAGATSEWMKLVNPGAGSWRGTRQPRTSLIGAAEQVERLGGLIANTELVVVTGPGGVGKTRLALAAAESVQHCFADGVAVVELGRVPGERHQSVENALEMALDMVATMLAQEPKPLGGDLLLVLDNTEHLPQTTMLLVDRLLQEHPAAHLLITSRQPPHVPGASIWEIPALPPQAAAELLIERARTNCLDLSRDIEQVNELCLLLDGLPRLVEFAAYRLRTVSLPMLISDNQARKMLSFTDFSMLPHQRNLESSVRWSIDLLDERQQRFLAWLAGRPAAAPGPETDGAEPNSMELLPAIADSSLLRVDRGDRYEYRLLRHVQACLVLRSLPMPNVILLLDNSGFDAYVEDDGSPLFNPEGRAVIMLTRPGRASGRMPPWLAGVITVDPATLTDPARIRDALGNLRGLDYVVTLDEELLPVAARIRAELGIAGYSPEHVSLLTDLDLMRSRFVLSGVPVLEYAVLSGRGDADELFARFGAADIRPVNRVSPGPRWSARSQADWRRGKELAASVAEPYLAEQRLGGPRYAVLSDTHCFPSPAASRIVGLRADGAEVSVALSGTRRNRLLKLNEQVLGALSWHKGFLRAEIDSDAAGWLALNQVSVLPGRRASSAALRADYGAAPLRALLAAQLPGIADRAE